MIDVMTLKDLAPKTQQNYQHTLSKLAVDYGRPLHRLTADEVSSWVIGRIDAGLAEQTTNADVSALRLFYNDAMGQPDKVAGLHGRRVHDRLPRSISEADVLALIQGIHDLRYRTATLTAYGAGLRISEVVALQVSDIHSEKGLLRIGNGKGGHERITWIPDPVLATLRHYWSATVPHPTSWLFFHHNPDRPIHGRRDYAS